MKIILVAVSLALLSGCSAFQPSSYTNYNTPYGNVVRATGTAASNAAFANTSYNCPSCAISGMGSSMSGGFRNFNQQTSEMGKITSSAIRTLSTTISSEINSAISNSIRGY